MNKIIGLDITEKEYRDLPYPSYSLLSDVSKNGPQVIGGARNTDIGELDGVIVGKIVDSILTDKKVPENLFKVKKTPSGKVKAILKALAYNAEMMPNPNKLLSKENEEIIDNICEKVKYLKTKESRLKGIKNYEDYYEVIKKVIKENKYNPDENNASLEDSMIVSDYLYNVSVYLAKKLKKEFEYFFGDKINKSREVFYQVKIIGEIKNVKFKGMLDGLVIDHVNKTIIPFDLKTGSYPANKFIEKGLIGWNYYIQAALYTALLEQYIDTHHPEYKEYKMDSFKFIYADRLNSKETLYFDTKNIENFNDSAMNKNLLQNISTFEEYEIKSVSDLIDVYKKHIDDNSGDRKV